MTYRSVEKVDGGENIVNVTIDRNLVSPQEFIDNWNQMYFGDRATRYYLEFKVVAESPH